MVIDWGGVPTVMFKRGPYFEWIMGRETMGLDVAGRMSPAQRKRRIERCEMKPLCVLVHIMRRVRLLNDNWKAENVGRLVSYAAWPVGVFRHLDVRGK
jgi:hypothetical protein